MATLSIERTWDGQPIAPGERCRVELAVTGGGWRIDVEAPFHRDPAPEAPVGALDGLWNFEVVEIFVAAVETAEYAEIELSPHGHHLILLFEGPRRRCAQGLPTAVECRIRGDRWWGRLDLDRDVLPAPPWRANAFAMHGRGAARRYLAAHALPGTRPDFHQPSAFPRLAETEVMP